MEKPVSKVERFAAACAVIRKMVDSDSYGTVTIHIESGHCVRAVPSQSLRLDNTVDVENYLS